MRYITRPGVVLTNICDEYFLVSGKEARDHCPYVTHLNDTACFIWEKLTAGMSEDEILEAVKDEFETDNIGEISEVISAFISQLKDNGYMIEKVEDR